MPTSSTDSTISISFSRPAALTAESSIDGLPLERMAVRLLLARSVERVDRAAAVGAVHPLVRDTELELGDVELAGDNAFIATAASGPAIAAPRATALTQGALESSNTDMSEAMVAMIESQRAYQLVSKAISTADEMMGIANQVKR